MKTQLILLASVLAHSGIAEACDPCALFNAARLEATSGGALTVAVSEQLTSYERGDENIKQGDFTRLYSTTQISAAYDVDDKVSIQLVLPIVAREFDEVRNFRLRERSEGGVGDMSLTVGYSLLSSFTPERSYFLNVGAGIKMPTGDTGSLEDSLAAGTEEENHADEARHARNVAVAVQHHQAPAIGGASGRILSIGTGSWDVPLLLAGSTRYERWAASFYTQYDIRTEGDFEYRFANDFLWGARAGRYLALEDEYTAGVMLAFSGEHKGQDTVDGASIDGSELSNLYLGPVLVVTAADRLVAELGVDLPVRVDDEEGQIEPDYRLTATIAGRF